MNNPDIKEIELKNLLMLDVTIDGSQRDIEKFLEKNQFPVPAFVHNKSITVKAIYDPQKIEKIKEIVKV